MSTKTMRLPPRRVSNSMPSSTDNNNSSQKRKDRDAFDLKPPLSKSPRPPPPPVGDSNQLLAGYLAFEFLSRGTVFGQMWDPARSQPDEEAAEEEEEKRKRYVGLANLMKAGGAQLAGIVNPGDLARLLQM